MRCRFVILSKSPPNIEMETATDRQERVSWWRQGLLNDAHVAVVGAGALGNEVLKNLALMGVGNIYVYDFDHIDLSNLSRTVLFDQDSLGQPKATVAASRAARLNVNPKSTTQGHSLDVVWDLGGGRLRRMDVVLGCLDNLEARLAVGRMCYILSVPLIDGGIRELGGRVQLHHSGTGACMECTIGTGERSQLTRRYACLNVLRSFVPEELVPTVQVSSAFIAALMCQEAVKFIQGKSVAFGSVISWFGETNDFDVLRLLKREDCLTCGVPPPLPIHELQLSAEDTVNNLLATVGNDWAIHLPSPFIMSLTCGLCGRRQEIRYPSHRRKDTDICCAHCNNTELIDIETITELNATTRGTIGDLTLNQTGIPAGAVLFATNGVAVALLNSPPIAARFHILKRRLIMAVVNVTFRNPVTGDTRENSQVEDSSTVSDVVQKLEQHGFIPSPKPGQHYVLEIKSKAELTDDSATLSSGGVANGDTINVVLAQRGGEQWSTLE